VPHRPASLDQAFDVLGLVPGALPAEVKRAYRKLAMHWHPDRNPAPEATERFRQVRAAYDFVLSGGEDDAEEMPDDEPAPEPETTASPTPGPDQLETIWLSIEEAIFGTTHAFELGEDVVCDACEGAGKLDLGRSCLCEACHGSGRIRTTGGLDKCSICGGRGFVSVVPCEPCDGHGRLKRSRKVRVTVPPLMWVGRRLRLNGQAETEGDRPPGDLLLEARIKDHPLYRIDGDDLLMDMPVSGVDVLFGRRLRVPVPGGQTEAVLAPAAGDLSPLVFDGEGMPRRQGGRGALRITLLPVWPNLSDPVDQLALAQWRAHLDTRVTETLPDVAQWRQQWLGTVDAAVSEEVDVTASIEPGPDGARAEAGADAAGVGEGGKSRKSKSKKAPGKRKAAGEKSKSSEARPRRKKS